MDFIDTLRSNAYSALDVTDHIVDISGWMDPNFSTVVASLVAARSKTDRLVVVEVGSWKGLSASTFASTLKSNGFTNFTILCIDTWLGAPEFWTWGLNDPTRGESLNKVNGWPTVFTTFTKNMKKLGHDDVVVPLPLSSMQAADVLAYYKIAADIVYIDAAHEYEPVKQDIKAYWPLVKPGGTLMGDDYMDSWPGVKHAVSEIFGTPALSGVIWSVSKT
jgi:hypothetical protein